MKTIKQVLLLSTLLFSFCLQGQDDKVIDKIVGKVGDRIVLYSDVEVQFQQSQAQGNPASRCDVLDNILLEKLLVNQAELDSVVVSEDEVESELNNRFRYYINLLGSEEAFEAHFQKSVQQFKEEFRPEIESLLLAQRMQQSVLNSVSVTPSEVREFYHNMPARQGLQQITRIERTHRKWQRFL